MPLAVPLTVTGSHVLNGDQSRTVTVEVKDNNNVILSTRTETFAPGTGEGYAKDTMVQIMREEISNLANANIPDNLSFQFDPMTGLQAALKRMR